MTDEEKKAIESLKKDLDCTVITFCKAGLEDIKIVLNLIEKQSKEIEEYKKQLDLDYVKNNYTSNDKIKAKIEEYEKMKEATKMDITYYGEKRRLVIEGVIAEFQSLLEKE